MDDENKISYEFGEFRLDVTERRLIKNGEPVPLSPKTFDVLSALVQNHGRLVTKDELMKKVWQDTFVDESSLTSNIHVLRKALGEDQSGRSYIETVPRHGYRFVATAQRATAPQSDSLSPEHRRATIIPEAENRKSHGKAPKVGRLPRFSDIFGGRSLNPSVKSTRVIFLALALLLLGGAFITFWRSTKHADSSPPNRPVSSIAVLPFKSIDGRGIDEHLGLGMTDATITKLSGLQQFTVRPTSAIFQFAEKNYDPLQAGRELGVDAVLEGTVQRVGDEVRISVRLLSVSDGGSIWAERFGGRFTDIFALQDDISTQVAQALRLKLTGADARQFVKRYTENVEAYEAYARGLYFWNKRTEEALKRSIEYFERATRLDSRYALAYAALADAYGLVGYYRYNFLTPEEAFQKSKEAALKALTLDSTIAEAHVAVGFSKNFEGDKSGAEEAFKRALALNPDSVLARLRYSNFLLSENRVDDAALHAKRAQELDPISTIYSGNYASVLYFQRRYLEAAANARKALEVDPDHPHALLILALCYEQMDKFKEAVELLEKRMRLMSLRSSDIDLETLRSLGHAYAMSGRRNEAERMLLKLDELSKSNGEALFSMALIYAALGRMDRVFEVLEKRAPQWDREPIGLKVDPRYDRIRADPRYAALIERRFEAAS